MPLNIVMTKVYNYNTLHTIVDNECTASVIVDLCRDREIQKSDKLTSSDYE